MYQHPIEVLRHPVTNRLLILPGAESAGALILWGVSKHPKLLSISKNMPVFAYIKSPLEMAVNIRFIYRAGDYLYPLLHGYLKGSVRNTETLVSSAFHPFEKGPRMDPQQKTAQRLPLPAVPNILKHPSGSSMLPQHG